MEYYVTQIVLEKMVGKIITYVFDSQRRINLAN